MKKILIIIAIIIVFLIANKDESIIIPESAIRFRVIANSNTPEDQVNKNKVSKFLNSYLYELIKDAKTSQEAHEILNKNYETINQKVNNFMLTNNIRSKYKITVGRNYFPKKQFKGITYDEGYYDSLVLSLGQEQGMNWWCIMYPPLCLINEETEDYEYTSLIQEILDKYNI